MITGAGPRRTVPPTLGAIVGRVVGLRFGKSCPVKVAREPGGNLTPADSRWATPGKSTNNLDTPPSQDSSHK